MKIAVLGASGKAGLKIVIEAVNRGLRVSAFVRNSEKLHSLCKTTFKIKVISCLKSKWG